MERFVEHYPGITLGSGPGSGPAQAGPGPRPDVSLCLGLVHAPHFHQRPGPSHSWPNWVWAWPRARWIWSKLCFEVLGLTNYVAGGSCECTAAVQDMVAACGCMLQVHVAFHLHFEPPKTQASFQMSYRALVICALSYRTWSSRPARGPKLAIRLPWLPSS